MNEKQPSFDNIVETLKKWFDAGKEMVPDFFGNSDAEFIFAVAKELDSVLSEKRGRDRSFVELVDEIWVGIESDFDSMGYSSDDARAALTSLTHRGYILRWATQRFHNWKRVYWKRVYWKTVYWLHPRNRNFLKFLANYHERVYRITLV